jgi:hypothetical protein
MYQDFLTPAEIVELLDDKDIWLDSKQVFERLQKRLKQDEKKIQQPQRKKRKAKTSS